MAAQSIVGMKLKAFAEDTMKIGKEKAPRAVESFIVDYVRNLQKNSQECVRFLVNGRVHTLKAGEIDPEMTLLEYLRRVCHFTGIKLGCGEGGCGACTVTLTKPDMSSPTGFSHNAVNGCLIPLCALDGTAVTTVEGIAKDGNSMHPLQTIFAESHASQCGYCTPGFIMSIYSKMLDSSSSPQIPIKSTDIEDCLDGNLCRCTGYRPILDAVRQIPSKVLGVDTLADREEDTNGSSSTRTNGHSHSSRWASSSFDSTSGTHNGSSYNGSSLNGHASNGEVYAHLNGGNADKHSKKLLLGFEGLPPNGSPSDSKKCSGCPFKGGMQEVEAITKSLQESILAKREEFSLHSAPDGRKATLYVPGKHLGVAADWYTPCSLNDMLCVMKHLELRGENYRLLNGNTEVRVERLFKTGESPAPHLLFTMNIAELSSISWDSEGVAVGSGVPLTRIKDDFQAYIDAHQGSSEAYKLRVLRAYVNMLRWFAGTQIRNVATLGGNIMTASPISDLNPLHVASDVYLKVAYLAYDDENGVERRLSPSSLKNPSGGLSEAASPKGVPTVRYRKQHMAEGFFLGYRKIAVSPDEVIVSVHIPFTRKNEYFYCFKQCKRREDDISIVNAAMRVLLKGGEEGDDGVYDEVVDSSFVYGGMAPWTKRCLEYEKYWKGKKFNKENWESSVECLRRETYLPTDVPGGMSSFRQLLAISFAYKFFLQVLKKVHPEEDVVPPSELSALLHPTNDYEKVHPKGLQHYGAHHEDLTKQEAGNSRKHLAADLHVTGRAEYTDDAPLLPNEVYLELVVSTQAHAKIRSVDISECYSVEGFVDYVCYKDIPGKNAMGIGVLDETVFAVDKALCVGHPIGIVAATNQVAAKQAMRKVKIDYEPLPTVLTIREAIEAESYFETIPSLPGVKHLQLERISDERFKDITEVFKHYEALAESNPEAVRIVSGESYLAGQEHFYLETQAVRIIPAENNEFLVISSTQNVTKTQSTIASVLGIPMNRIVSKCKRMGGGFGGKESRACFFAAYASVAAHKLRRPVRMQLDRDVDMVTSGQRHPFMFRYKLAIDVPTKKLVALDCEIYCNAGWSTDLSLGVLERAVFHATNSYYIPNVRSTGRACKTNLSSNTAFRGFGGPQGMYMVELYLEQAAREIKVPVEEMMMNNFFHAAQLTHYLQPVKTNRMRDIFTSLMSSADYQKRQEEIAQFNHKNRYVKRGIAIVPVTFGMSFTKVFMNQAGSLVHLYTDGTVLISHAGHEMGQGLNTKVAQVAATCFDISLDDVYINETSTDKVANAMPTAASVGSDLNGFAVKDACDRIKERLKPYYGSGGASAQSSSGSSTQSVLSNEDRRKRLASVALAAHMNRVSLSAVGFYKTPDVGYDFATNKGKPFHYHSHGGCVAEVQLDCLTGDHVIRRADILHDVGSSLNPVIDIGQIEGAFAQGSGLCTIEEPIFMANGTLFTKGPGTYKIPTAGDIPLDFRVSLMPNVPNEDTIHGSKGVGEPPLFLGFSVYFALKRAIEAYRQDYLDSLIEDAKSSLPEESMPLAIEALEYMKTAFFRLDSPATAERIRDACWDRFNMRAPRLLGLPIPHTLIGATTADASGNVRSLKYSNAIDDAVELNEKYLNEVPAFTNPRLASSLRKFLDAGVSIPTDLIPTTFTTTWHPCV
uniref:Xanthine dehydrogenase n=1 Tax=Nephromyces sp. MMRI TaxID=2496275 RepID=A0A3Q8UBZ6_9APIC|nr:xanthine dehydrogenase [Nephromyces sp. MMRI]AZL94600.1 xanthine dehydrogenase [Nephromyces sp. MMRI]